MARKRTIREEDLIEAARACFQERGFAVPTKEIARRAGVSEGLLFLRYGNKAELFFAAMVPPAGEDLRQLLASAGTGMEEFVALGQSLVRYFRETADVLLPLMTYPDFRFEELALRYPDSAFAAMRREAMAYFGRTGAADPAASALLLLSSTFGLVMFEKLGAHDGAMPPVFVRRMLERVRAASFGAA